MVIIDAAAVFGLGTVGMIAHWAKRWKRGETVTTLYQYITTNKVATIKAVFATFVAVNGAVIAGADYHVLNGISLLVMAGYGCDSIFNKDIEDTDTGDKV